MKCKSGYKPKNGECVKTERDNKEIKKNKKGLWGILLILIGAVLLYINSTYSVCQGWNIINPLCWGSSLIIHSVLLLGGIILIIVGIIKLIKG